MGSFQEDDLDLPPQEYKSDPKTNCSYSSYKRDIKWKLIFIAIFFIIFFTILFICTYVIPRDEYLEAKKQDPKLEFQEPYTPGDALHWTNYCIFLIFLLGLIGYASDHPKEFFYVMFLTIYVVFGLFSAGIWIAYAATIANSGTVKTAWDKHFSYDNYNKNITNIKVEKPYIKISASGYTSTGRKHRTYYYCNPEAIIVNSTNCSTTYNLPELHNHSWVNIIYNITSTQDIDDFVERVGQKYKDSLPTTDERGLTISWKYDIRFGFNSEINGLYFVTKSNELEGKLKKSNGKAMMAFWAGVGYVYRLRSYPVFRPIISKSDIEIDLPELPDNDPIWDRIAQTKCILE